MSNLAIFKIWVFLAICLHEITLSAIDIGKKRFITLFSILWNHFENRTSIELKYPQHLRVCHMFAKKKNIFRKKTSSITSDPPLSLDINPFSSRRIWKRRHYFHLWNCLTLSPCVHRSGERNIRRLGQGTGSVWGSTGWYTIILCQ